MGTCGFVVTMGVVLTVIAVGKPRGERVQRLQAAPK
jgi:hypothetical protein